MVKEVSKKVDKWFQWQNLTLLANRFCKWLMNVFFRQVELGGTLRRVNGTKKGKVMASGKSVTIFIDLITVDIL